MFSNIYLINSKSANDTYYSHASRELIDQILEFATLSMEAFHLASYFSTQILS